MILKKSKRSAVKIVANNDVRTTFEQIENRRLGRESGSDRNAARSALEISNAFFISEPGRINRPRVVVAFVLARTFLDVSRCSVNRRHDRAGRWIGLLSGVDRAGCERVLFLHVIPNVMQISRARQFRDR